MRSRTYTFLNQLFALGLFLFLTGCGGGGSSSSTAGTGAITAKIVAASPSQTVLQKASAALFQKSGITTTLPDAVTIRLSVSGPGMGTISKEFPVADGKGTVDGVPVGTGRLLVVEALNASGTAVYGAKVNNITVTEGQTSDTGTVTLTPLNVFTTAMLSGRTLSFNTSEPESGSITYNIDGTFSRTSYTFAKTTTGTWSINSSGQLLLNDSDSTVSTVTLTNSSSTAMTASVNVSRPNGSSSNIITSFAASTGTTNYSISGKVTINGSGMAGVSIATNGISTTTLADGSYTISGLQNGNYTLTASNNDYLFTPSSIATTVNNANVTEQNFTATIVAPSTYSISGTVTSGGSALSGVTITTSGGSTTTLADGTYTINGLQNGNYTLTASKSGYSFTPTSLAVTVNGANVINKTFTGTTTVPSTYSISGKVTCSGNSGISDVIVTATLAASSYSATTQSDGSYTISGVPNGSYTLTSSKSSYSFSPSSITLTVNNANVTGQNFTGTSTLSSTVIACEFSGSHSCVEYYGTIDSTICSYNGATYVGSSCPTVNLTGGVCTNNNSSGSIIYYRQYFYSPSNPTSVQIACTGVGYTWSAN